MMRWIVGSSLQFRFLVVVLAIVLIVYGIDILPQASVDVLPEFDPPLVEVQTEALGLSAAEMEALLTVPMEADLLNGVAWLDEIHSESVAGMSSILLIFEQGTDPIKARQMVQERLTQTFALPNVSKPPNMLQPLSTTSRVMIVALSSSDLSLIDLSLLARWTIQPRLMGVKGVSNVAIWGQRDWQLQVLVDPEQLHNQGVTLNQVIRTTGEALWVSPLSYLESSTPGTAGWIDTPNQRLSIRHELPITSPEALAQVPVVGSGELVLDDVADVIADHQPLIGDAQLNGGSSLLLIIEKFPEANTLAVTKGVEDALEEMKPGLNGVEIDTTVYRQATYVEKSIDNLTSALITGAVLVVLLLGAFFFNWRSALISLVAIALSVGSAALVLHLRGTTFNMLILAGLVAVLGVIIDDAIIDVENIMRRLRLYRQQGSSRTAESIIMEAMLETRSPMIFATLITLLLVLPILFFTGMTGSFLRPFAISYVLAVFTSLAVALIITPTLSLMILAGSPLERRESPLARVLQRGYNRILAGTMRAPVWAFIIAVAVVIVGLVGLPLLKQSLLPSFKQTDLLIQLEAAPGTSSIEMNRIMTLVSSELRSIEGVRNVGSHIGRAVTGDQVVGINSGEVWVSIDPSVDYDATVAAIEAVIDGYPGLSREVQTYTPERLDEALTGPSEDIVVRVYGHDYAALSEKAEEVRQSIEGIDGVADVQVEPLVEEPEVQIQVNLEKAQQHGLKPGDVRRTASTLISGLTVGNLYQGQKVFDVVVWGVPKVRDSVNDIRDILIDTPTGDQVRLGEVADVTIASTPVVIKREGVSRYLDVNVHVSGRSVGAVASDINQRLDSIVFPSEYHAEVLGSYADRAAAQQRMLGIALTALIGIFLLLQACFKSWRLALVALIALPMTLAGGVMAVALAGGDLSLGSLFGFLTVLAIAVRNIVLLFSHFENLAANGETLGLELVLRGARERLVPILMTALTTILILLPVLIGGNRAGFEIVHPMAVVILGGLVTSTLLILFVLPVMYLRVAPTPVPETLSTPEVLRQPGTGVA